MTTADTEARDMLAERPDLLADTAQRALRYLAGLDSRRVAPAPADMAGLDRLDFPLPAAGLRPGRAGPARRRRLAGHRGQRRAALLRLRDRRGAARRAGRRLADRGLGPERRPQRHVAGRRAAGRGGAALGDRTPRPAPGTGGGFVTGATMANATCLAAARDAVLSRHGWDAAGQGLVGAPPVTVLVGEQVHTTVRKALGLIGLGRDRAIVLPADAQGRIVPRDPPRT